MAAPRPTPCRASSISCSSPRGRASSAAPAICPPEPQIQAPSEGEVQAAALGAANSTNLLWGIDIVGIAGVYCFHWELIWTFISGNSDIERGIPAPITASDR